MSRAHTEIQYHYRLALVGNPNSGKTTIFNGLTGLHQKVANYPGVTVERKEGRFTGPEGRRWVAIDLPGSYSLSPRTIDEAITRDVLLGRRKDTPKPDVIGVVVDASNLERNLYQVTQLMELGIPLVVILNMVDVAKRHRRPVDARALAEVLGVPVVETVGYRGEGIAELRAALGRALEGALPRVVVQVPAAARGPIKSVADELVKSATVSPTASGGEALRLICDESATEDGRSRLSPEVMAAVRRARCELELAGIDWRSLEADARYHFIESIAAEVIDTSAAAKVTVSERVDGVLTHPVFGPIIFAALMALIFHALYDWSGPMMGWIESLFSWLGALVSAVLPAGILRGLIVDGIIGGVGAVLIFLPQILILFFFIALLEETGYLARAAFIMDKLMSKVGLHGKAFIPLLSCYACAVPGIMATRTIENEKDRLVTIMVAPLMTCPARLPVYTLLIGAFIPATKLFGFWDARGFTLLMLYFLGVAFAILAALVLKKLVLRGRTPALIMEMPSYQLPSLKSVLMTMWQKSRDFVYRAGTVILLMTVILWFALNFPQAEPSVAGLQVPKVATEDAAAVAQAAPVEGEAAVSEQVRYSIAGRLGRLLEPVIRPLGFDWKVGVGLIGAFAAREVFVATMGVVYKVEGADEPSRSLKQAMVRDTYPDGSPVWTPLVAVSLLVFFAIAMQCMATLAVVYRETGGWKWPLIQVGYLSGLAWLLSFIVYQGGKALGWG